MSSVALRLISVDKAYTNYLYALVLMNVARYLYVFLCIYWVEKKKMVKTNNCVDWIVVYDDSFFI